MSMNRAYIYLGLEPEDNGLKDWLELPLEEQLDLLRRFGEASGLIEKTAVWEDTRAIEEFLRVINLEI
jgi:hypothetical protein